MVLDESELDEEDFPLPPPPEHLATLSMEAQFKVYKGKGGGALIPPAPTPRAPSTKVYKGGGALLPPAPPPEHLANLSMDAQFKVY